MGVDFEGCAAGERKRSKKQGREGGKEEGRAGGGEREESTPKSVTVASYWEVVPLQLAKIRQTIQGSHQTLPANFLLEPPR